MKIKQDMIPVFGNSFDGSDFKEVKKVLQSHMVGMGAVTEEFENEFKNRIGFKYACAVSSCTNGFWLLLRALDLKPQEEVIIPSIHFFGIKNVLELLKISYNIVDVGKSVPNVTLKEVKDHLTENTKAVIFLEYGGYPLLDIERIRRYLKTNGRGDVFLILDAANSPFTKYNGKYSALNFDFAVYSFDMNKILVTGDGGMVLSNEEHIINKVKSLAYYGILDPLKTGFERGKICDIWWQTDPAIPSLKLVMNNIAACLGLSQLNKIEKILEERSRVFNHYYRLLEPLEVDGIVKLPPRLKDAENCVYFFWLILKDEVIRNNLAKFLLRNNIYTTVKYAPLNKKINTPNAFEFYHHSLNLPLNQNVTREKQKYIVDSIYRFFDHEM